MAYSYFLRPENKKTKHFFKHVNYLFIEIKIVLILTKHFKNTKKKRIKKKFFFN